MKRFVWVLGVASLLAGTGSAQAALWQWDNIPIDGLQETPPVVTTGYGTAMATLDDVSGLMTISGSYADLVGTANNAHLHGPAPPGTPAGVIFGLSFSGGSSGTFSGSSTLSAANITNVLDGLTYINIHSTYKPLGEIRGQLWAVPEPASMALFIVGLSSLAMIRCKLRRLA